MGFSVTKKQIRTLCGSYSYDRGESDYRAGKVEWTGSDPERGRYAATVRGSRAGDRYRVSIGTDAGGDVQADCECLDPRLSARYCRHIAAVLLALCDKRENDTFGLEQLAAASSTRDGVGEAGAVSPSKDVSDDALAGGLLDLFAVRSPRPRRTSSLFDAREPLLAEFKLVVVAYGRRKHLLGVEMKIGARRAYSVPRIREFLARADNRESCAVSRHFTYDPVLHRFEEANDAVIRFLADLYRNEKIYRETSGAPFSVYSAPPGGDGYIPIPPSSWDGLYEKLVAAPDVRLEYDGTSYESLQPSDEPLPLSFDFGAEADGRYRLDVHGTEKLAVLEDYGVVLSEGKLHRLKPDQAERLAGLIKLLDDAGGSAVRIASAQMEPFLARVVPGLMKLGEVRLSPAVTERVVHVPLNARLYLDRVRDRLLAGLEFQYGEVILNPLEDRERELGAGRILVRDGDKEARIQELIERGGFVRTESGYYLEEEESQYDFLHHIVPLLEPLLKVYATTAVKARLYVGNPPPKIRVDVNERTDWMSCRFELDGFPPNEIRALIEAIADKRRYYRLASGALLPLETPDFEALNRFIVTMKVEKGEWGDGAEARIPVARALRLLDEDQRHPAIKLGQSVRKMLENVRNPDLLDFQVPESLAPVLRDYQKFGYQWLKTLALYRFGGILADDMGLGKTVQSIAYLVSVLPDIRREGTPALIVCPASLTYNWLGELARFAPEVRAVVADGSKLERTRSLKRLSDVDAVIVSYPLLRMDAEEYARLPFHTVFLDEAQTFKNYATQTAQAVKAIQARHRFALTGTPVENSLEELWSIFDAVFPELFRDRRTFGELTRETIAKRVRPFLLRRLKTDVLGELPEKIETNRTSELLPEQKKLYLAYLAKLRKQSLKHLDEGGFGRSRIRILAGLTRLRQLCCHPGLFVEGYEGGSAKFDQLMELLEECRDNGRRVLVFSQFTEMLGLIAKELGFRGLPYFYLDGQTPSAERVSLCERFNDGERDAFLISLKAGGTGLNLTGADTVILYDLWWNPAVERQAGSARKTSSK